jgi:hypothetical protein
LPHGLNRSDGVSEPDESALRDGSAGGNGSGAARVGEVGEDDGEGSVRGPVDQWRSAPSDESLTPQQGQ